MTPTWIEEAAKTFLGDRWELTEEGFNLHLIGTDIFIECGSPPDGYDVIEGMMPVALDFARLRDAMDAAETYAVERAAIGWPSVDRGRRAPWDSAPEVKP